MSAPDPYLLFNFEVTFKEFDLAQGMETGGELELCSAAFSEVTGLEATMEPKVIKEGGRNYGPVQRAGQVSFATVVLKRGITTQKDVSKWFALVAGGNYARRLNAYIKVRTQLGADETLYTVKLHRALPVKLKSPDLNASTTNVSIEELHLAHEGLEVMTTVSDVVEEVVETVRRVISRLVGTQA
jgi:phage tail-like protein